MLSRLWIRRLALAGATGAAVLASPLGCGNSDPTDDSPIGGDYDAGFNGGVYDVVFTQQKTGNAYSSSGYAVATYGVADEKVALAAQCKSDGYSQQVTSAASNAACTIVVCTAPVADTDDDGGTGYTPDHPQPTSGTVTLTTALVPAGVTMTPDNSGICSTGDDPIAAQWWTTGDTTIAVKSTGSLVPGFDRAGLVGPGDLSSITLNGLELTRGGADAGNEDAGPDPDQDFSGPTATIGRSKPLAITFAGGLAGTSVHLVLQTSSIDQESIVDCTFDATQGTQSLSAADLASLQATNDGDVTGKYYVDTLAQSAVKVGSWNVQARVVSLGPDALLVVGD